MVAAPSLRTPPHPLALSSPHPWLDILHAPVYIAHVPERATDDELAVFLEAMERQITSVPHRYAFVTDAHSVTHATAKQRRMVAESERRLAAHDRVWCAGVAIVAPTALVRGIVTAVYWLAAPVYPYVIVPTLAEALTWARGRLDAPRTPAADAPST